MSNTMLNVYQTLASGIRRNRTSWVITVYYKDPCTILDRKPNSIFSCSRENIRPMYVDTIFQFNVERISDLQFRIIFKRTHGLNPMLPGEYVIQFTCDTNVFDEGPKIVEMQSYELEVSMDFSLNATYRQDLASDDLKKHLEFKISVHMIENDCVYPSDNGHQLEELRKSNEVLNNVAVLIDLCLILQIPRIEDVFAGRQNGASAALKRFYISKAASFTKEILNYSNSKFRFAEPPNLEVLLNNVVNDKKKRLGDKELLGVYYEANLLGLNFLIELSRDCLLMRLSKYETRRFSDYEHLFHILFEAAVQVDDERLFHMCSEKLRNPKNEHFDIEGFLEKFNKCMHFRFVLRSLERFQKLESHSRFGIGLDARFYKLL